MSLFTTGSGELSRWYVSGTKETTIGVSAAATKSFFSIKNSVVQQEGYEKRKGITGKQNALEAVRTKLFSGGSLMDNCYPDFVNFLFYYLFGAAATNASAGASNTVYTHTWAAITGPPPTFSMTKQHGALSGVTEGLCGLGITEIKFSSTDGVISVEAKVDGLGAGYVIGIAEPAITPLSDASQAVMIGNASNLLIDDVSVGASLFSANWSVTINPGYGLLPTGGSTDGSITRFDKISQRSVTANAEIYITDATLFTEFVAKTTHKYEFRITGPTIDTPNSLTSQIKLIIPEARNYGKIDAQIGDMSTFKIPLQLDGTIASNGYDFQAVTQDLVANPWA